VNGLQGALQCRGAAQLPQGEIRLFGQQGTHLVLVLGNDQGLAPGPVMTGGNVAGMTALLKEFFDHAKGNSESPGHILARALLLIIRGQYSFP
jgi:hypothetical protein